MSFEETVTNGFFNQKSDKSFLSKLFADKEVQEIREIVKKERLSRSDLIDLLYMLTSTESKLYNFGERDRYIVLKYFVWIREFVAVIEQCFDYLEDQKKNDKQLDPLTEKIFENVFKLMEHNIKFLVDLYLNICRTSLSLRGAGFFESLKNKFEIGYSQPTLGAPQPQSKENNLITR